MPSTYTPNLRLTLPADGELVGTWGQTVNTGITALAETAISGTVSLNIANANKTLTTANGAADEARNMTIRITSALTAQRDVICPSVSKTYFVRNATTGGFGINFKTAAGTGIVVPMNGAMLLYCDGTNVVQAVTTIGTLDNTVIDVNSTLPALRVTQSGTGDVVLFEDSANPDPNPFVINNGGQVIAGHTASLSLAGLSPKLQILGTSTSGSSIWQGAWSTSAVVPGLNLLRSKGAAPGTFGLAGANDALGQIQWFGDDGADYLSTAILRVKIDGTPSLNVMPGRMEFLVSSSAASTAPVEAMRIDSAGRLIISPAGAAAQSTRLGSTTFTPNLQMEGLTGSSECTLGLFSWQDATTAAGHVTFAHSRSGVVGTHSAAKIAVDTDLMGRISWASSDGTKFVEGARISVEVDGTPTVDGMPSRMDFLTAASAGSVAYRGSFKSSPGFHIGDANVDGISSVVGLYNRPRLAATSTTQYGVNENTMFSTSATTLAYGFIANNRFADGVYTSSYVAFRAAAPTLGVGQTLSIARGIQISDMTATNTVTGIYCGVATGTDKWNLYALGTAPNYMLGALGIGVEPDAGPKLMVRNTAPAASPVWGGEETLIVQSGSVAGIQIHAGTTSATPLTLGFSVGTVKNKGAIQYAHTTDTMSFVTASTPSVSLTAAGSALFSNGTVALPGLAFISDPDLGFFRQAANVIGIAGSGAESFRLDTVTNTFYIGNIASGGYGSLSSSRWSSFGAAGVTMHIVPESADGLGNLTIQLFRFSNTTGTMGLNIATGNGSTNNEHIIYSRNPGGPMAVMCRLGGRMLVGHNVDDAINTLQVNGATAIYNDVDTKSGITPNSNYNNLVIDSTGNVGMTIMTSSDSGTSAVMFGNSSSPSDAQIIYGNATSGSLPRKLRLVAGAQSVITMSAVDIVCHKPIDAPNLTSGTYTPTGFTGTNITAVTPALNYWFRIGDTVTVFGRVVVTATASVRSAFSLSLPVPSALSSTTQMAGTFAGLSGVDTSAGVISAETTNDRAAFAMNVEGTGSKTYSYSYSYVVI